MSYSSKPLQFVANGLVSPISGNRSNGGACYDGKDQALYGLYINGAFQVWRTRGGYERLRDQDDSVDYLSTILTVTTQVEPPSVALTRINGVVYASISAWLGDGSAGNWIYRDTGGGGVGPWVQHGTIQAITGATGGDTAGDTPFASEIMVMPDGTWVTNAPTWIPFAGTGTGRRGGVYSSSDAGATWTNRLDVFFGSVSGLYGDSWARNFGQFGGAWYVGGEGNIESGKHYKSSDGITWTDIGSLGAGVGYGYVFPISDPQWIYRWAPVSDSSSYRILQSAPAAPETMPLWANFTPTGIPFMVSGVGSVAYHQYPIVCNVGPSTAPVWVATNWGQVLSLGVGQTLMPPCRQYPREDGLGTSSARRIYPQPRSEQGGIRRAGGTYY